MANPRKPRASPLGDRIDAVCRARQISARAWSLKGAQSPRYLAQQRLRAAEDPAFVLPEKRAALLAEALDPPISVEWLRFGRGAMDDPSGGLSRSGGSSGRKLPAEVELAFYDAIGAGEFAAEDSLTARRIVDDSSEWLPRDRSEAARAIKRLLDVVAAVRQTGRVATANGALWTLLLATPPRQTRRPAPPDPPGRLYLWPPPANDR